MARASVFLGMMLGLILALVSLLASGPTELPEGAVALVAQRPISQEEYARALSAVVTDSGRALTAAERRRILDRLIDEELLIQYGLDQGLVRSDRRVRAHLVSAVIEAKSIEAEIREISDAEARVFYQANVNYFVQPQQLKLRVLRLMDANQGPAIARAWSGDVELAELAEAYVFERLNHLPHALLPVGKLRQLIGASLTDAALRLTVGQVSAPVMINQRAHLLRVDERINVPARYEQLSELVKAEMRRREAEQALRQELDMLRGEMDVRIAEDRL